MQIQVNSDSSVQVDDQLTEMVQASVDKELDRFGKQITRVEVHLSDVNAQRSGSHDKRCVMEARPAGLDPVAVTNEAATVEAAVSGAAQKLQRLLASRFGRLGAS